MLCACVLCTYAVHIFCLTFVSPHLPVYMCLSFLSSLLSRHALSLSLSRVRVCVCVCVQALQGRLDTVRSSVGHRSRISSAQPQPPPTCQRMSVSPYVCAHRAVAVL